MASTKFKLLSAIGLLTLCLSSYAQISMNAEGYYPGEGITYDALTEKYTIKYLDYDGITGSIVTLQYQTPNKVKPTLKMRLRSDRGRDVTYSFDVGNQRTATQAMYTFNMYAQMGYPFSSTFTKPPIFP